MTMEECADTPEGHHVSDEGEGDMCERCEAERCPVCGRWWSSYEALEQHLSQGWGDGIGALEEGTGA